MNIKKLILSVIGTATLLPEFVSAQLKYGIGESMTANGMLGIIISTLENVILILVSLAVLYFLFGLIKYITTAASDDKTEAAGVIMNGIITLFVMTSLWGLVTMVSKTFLKEGDNGQLKNAPIDISEITN